ncbi:hypothetical protein JOC77_002858 [Peribacillus deserti]|uniref:Methyltransferase type 11 domain-containing protein n=1 Tax=Peribacillus deserti TaxID=673318 RepID=A0ABS2QJU0_9BACI|nr:class I SAM-dependent methyltransferase [Peribacillus deserti]MBM7693418.1 hypothetical protein [Peribacillus deserti]
MLEIERDITPYSAHTLLAPSYRIDTRDFTEKEYNKFVKLNTVRDWSSLKWKDVGRPYQVTSYAKDKKNWETENRRELPARTSWEMFNKSFHEWFVKDVPQEMDITKERFFNSLKQFKPAETKAAAGGFIRIHLWNYVHRIQDGIWDPRGKRALFEGLELKAPKILFLGAAEGYEAMQLASLYPGSEIVLVDYDPFCKDTRYGEFPDSYPFLGEDPLTGGKKIYYKTDIPTEYVVSDIRKLPFGHEFDIVLSVGLLEHFPDEMKAEVVEWHRKFLKAGGYIIMTTPRAQLRSKLYYEIMADVMNHTYRELMTIEQMGLYLYENGLDILRHGYIKVHNGIVARAR